MLQWKEYFAPHILERGESYFADGRVHDLKKTGGAVTAAVCGSEDYEVELEFAKGRFMSAFCSCPYAEGGKLCKHAAAVCFALEADEAAETKAKPAGEKQSAPAAPAFEQIVQKLSAEQVRRILLDIASKNEDIQNRILLLATGRLPPERMKALKSRVTRLARSAVGRDGFIEYREASGFTNALEDFLEREVRPLMTSALVMEAFDLTCHVFLAVNRYDMDDSDGGLALLHGHCAELWEEQAALATEKQREKMYGWFEKTQERGMADYAEEVLWQTQSTAFQDVPLLKRSLAHVDKMLAEAERAADGWRREYALGYAAAERLRLMKRLKLPKAEITAFEEKYHSVSEVRQFQMDEHMQAQDWTQAAALLRESKMLDADKPGLVARYSERLIQIYANQGDVSALTEELRYQIFQCRQDNLQYIQMLKEYTAPEEWVELRETILRARTVFGVRLQLLESEGLWRRLLDEIRKDGSCWEMDRFESALKARFPAETMQFYLDYLRGRMPEAANRKAYWTLIQYLKRISQYPGGKEPACALAQEWRERFPRRRSLLDELDKAGF